MFVDNFVNAQVQQSCPNTEMWCKLVQIWYGFESGKVQDGMSVAIVDDVLVNFSVLFFFFFFFTLELLWNLTAKPRIGRMAGTVAHSHPHTKRKIITVLPAHAVVARFGNASRLSNTLWSPTHQMRAWGSLWVSPPAVSLLALPNLRHMNLPMKDLETLNTLSALFSHLDPSRCVNISKAT